MKRNRIIWFALWIVSLVTISFYGGTISYGFFFAVTLIPVISLIYLICVYGSFKLYQNIESKDMVCRQPIPYFFVLQNDSWFAFAGVSVRLFSSFSEVEEMPDNQEYELLPGDKFTFETRLACKVRGEYEVGIQKIILTDFLRLIRLRYTIPSTIKAKVLPRVIRLAAVRSIQDAEVLLMREERRSKTEPDLSVRDYQRGDEWKQIHWKATAREQKLKVRNRIGEEKQGLFLYCDTRRYSRQMQQYLPLENKMLEVFLALGMYFAGKNVSFSAYCGQNGQLPWQVYGLQDFDGFYQKTAEVSFREEQDAAEEIGLLCENGLLQQNRIVFLVLHAPDEKILGRAEQLISGGTIVVIYWVTDEKTTELPLQDHPRRRVIVISSDAELEEIL